jgi:hypothetical protein
VHHEVAENGIRPAGMANGDRGPYSGVASGPTMMARIGVMKALNRHVGCSIRIAKIIAGESGS